MKAQRLRLTFSRGDEMKYITHLDLMRFWERALRRASLPVAYSEGFSPHAQIAMAAPLPVGTTSDGELMDVFMSEPVRPRRLIGELTPELPAGVTVMRVEEVGLTLPALQADVRFAEYVVDLAGGATTAVGGSSASEQSDDRPAEDGGWTLEAGLSAADAIERFLAAASVPWQHKREDEVRTYDLRPLVESIEVIEEGAERVQLRMLLKNDSNGSGRPEQVAAALGLPSPNRIHRTRLVLSGASPARDAWRKRGKYAG